MLGRAALLCVGKLNERFLREGCAEYDKRLSRYLKLSIEEIKDRPDAIPDARALEEEGAELLRRVAPELFRSVALAIGGKAMDSIALSAALAEKLSTGRRVVFLIGGSRGLAPAVLARAELQLSFSAMTFPHGLARLMLLEQLYRSCRIASGEVYHK